MEGGDRRPVRVLVAAGNEVVRAGIAALIGERPGFAVFEVSPGSTALVEEAKARRPDVLLVDLTMSGTLREFLDARTRESMPDVAVVALAMNDVPDIHVLRDLSRYGIDGIVTANDPAPQLNDALEAVGRGLRWLSPAIGGQLLEALTQPADGRSTTQAATGATSLTERERSVLALVADGLTVSQIAKSLHRSESAVKYHLSNMSARYQASNRAHLVYLAIQAGELPVALPECPV